jgi:hypothetical protein
MSSKLSLAESDCRKKRDELRSAALALKEAGHVQQEIDMLLELTTLPADNIQTIETIRQLSNAYSRLGDHRCALKWAVNAMEFAKTMLSWNDRHIAITSALAAVAYERVGELDVSFKLLLDVLQFLICFAPQNDRDINATIIRLIELKTGHPEFEQLHLKETDLYKLTNLCNQMCLFKQMEQKYKNPS